MITTEFYQHQIVVSFTIYCSEWLDIKYTQMYLSIHQNMVNLIVGFHIWRHPRLFMDVAICEHCTFNCEIFRCGKFYYSNSIIITNFV
jgi:hypothetical protein